MSPRAMALTLCALLTPAPSTLMNKPQHRGGAPTKSAYQGERPSEADHTEQQFDHRHPSCSDETPRDTDRCRCRDRVCRVHIHDQRIAYVEYSCYTEANDKAQDERYRQMRVLRK